MIAEMMWARVIYTIKDRESFQSGLASTTDVDQDILWW